MKYEVYENREVGLATIERINLKQPELLHYRWLIA